MNLPRLHITQNGILYQNSFYKHSSYDFFIINQDCIQFIKSFQNNDRKIFTIHNLDKEEITYIINTLM